MKEKHPDAIHLVRIDNSYRLYNEDARRGAEILGIALDTQPEKGFAVSAEFRYNQLDTFLPKLVRAGERIVISDNVAREQQERPATREQNEVETETHRGMHR